jgi:uncharacterized membrane protein
MVSLIPVFISPRNRVAQLYSSHWFPFTSPLMTLRSTVDIILTRLQTSFKSNLFWSLIWFSFTWLLQVPNRERGQALHIMLLMNPYGGSMFIEPFLKNDCLFWLNNHGFELHVTVFTSPLTNLSIVSSIPMYGIFADIRYDSLEGGSVHYKTFFYK